MIGVVDPRQAAAEFCPDGATCQVTPLGSGNINDTFLVAAEVGPFVLQRINRQVFPEPRRVINNFARVTSHLRGRRGKGGAIFRTALPVPTRTGTLCFCDPQGDYWRGQTYLPHSNCHTLSGASQAQQIGRALATFHHLVAGLGGQELADPLPGFHNLPGYLQEFDRVRRATTERQDGAPCRYCLESIDRGRQRATLLEEAKIAGLLTIQPIHGDPKIDNFLFDDKGQADGMLDLDTVGMGIVHYDLGDCLRSCCNRAGEEGVGGQEVTFDLEICRALLQGYFSEAHGLLTASQRAFIFDAVLGITFELGLRFLTDHLRGNSYFRVLQDGENLLRATRQFRLTEAIVAEEAVIRRLALTAGV